MSKKSVVSSEYAMFKSDLFDSCFVFFTLDHGCENCLVLSDQVFSYLIVIDFESTCWREKNNRSQEISKEQIYRSQFTIHPLDVLTVLTPVHLFFLPPCSRVSCCSAEHVHGGGGV